MNFNKVKQVLAPCKSTVWMCLIFFAQNQSQVATSLQVFHNLGSLLPTVDRVVQGCQDNLLKAVQASLDVQSLTQTTAALSKRGLCFGTVFFLEGHLVTPTSDFINITKASGDFFLGVPGKATMPAPGNIAVFRATLWTNMEKVMDNIHSACTQVMQQ